MPLFLAHQHIHNDAPLFQKQLEFMSVGDYETSTVSAFKLTNYSSYRKSRTILQLCKSNISIE